jgi:DNA-binding NtrC family response regulator
MVECIRVLVVEDEAKQARLLEEELGERGFAVRAVGSAEEAIALAAEESFDVALLDIRLPGMDGVAALRALKEREPYMEAIMLTGHGTLEDAVASMKQGAYDFLTKPYRLSELKALIEKAGEKKRLREQNATMRQELARRSRFPEFVGNSRQVQQLLEIIARVAPLDSTVLIYGESGTGKELVANAIHSNSVRRSAPFVAVSCGALQEPLLESELFGYEKGAFTGATAQKHGLLEVADGGTFFLDEVAELTPAMQAKLLRVIELGEIRRVGGTKSFRVDVRLVAATNRDLQLEIKEKRFRDDLFYRLNVVTIVTPPLRERREDIPLLAEHFLAKHGRFLGKPELSLSAEAGQLLNEYQWPGNVRELENVMERAIILADDVVLPAHLPQNLRGGATGQEAEAEEALELREVERRHILQVLAACHGNKAKAARLLGIGPRTLYRKLAEYNGGTGEG